MLEQPGLFDAPAPEKVVRVPLGTRRDPHDDALLPEGEPLDDITDILEAIDGISYSDNYDALTIWRKADGSWDIHLFYKSATHAVKVNDINIGDAILEAVNINRRIGRDF